MGLTAMQVEYRRNKLILLSLKHRGTQSVHTLAVARQTYEATNLLAERLNHRRVEQFPLSQQITLYEVYDDYTRA